MGKSTISMAIFNSYVKLPEGIGIPSVFQTPGICHQQKMFWVCPKMLDLPTSIWICRIVIIKIYHFTWRHSISYKTKTYYIEDEDPILRECKLAMWNSIFWFVQKKHRQS